jgi:hypothetical protein
MFLKDLKKLRVVLNIIDQLSIPVDSVKILFDNQTNATSHSCIRMYILQLHDSASNSNIMTTWYTL